MSGGLRSGLSEYGRKVSHFTLAQNVEFRPFGAVRCRPGSQLGSTATLTKLPHTLLEWVAAAGTSNKYIAAEDKLYRYTGSALTLQTIPVAPTTGKRWSWDQLNGSIWATVEDASSAPFFYGPDNASETWITMTFPTPAATMTLTPGAGGALATGAGQHYWYRLRHFFKDGVSKASTPQDTGAMGANNKVTITTIPISPAGRTDYLGWVLERTDALGSVTGPFYFLAEGTANNYTDILADTALDYKSDDIRDGHVPENMVGLIAMNDRLLGWAGSRVYLSQAMGDSDIDYTGIANWDARNEYDFGRDDGDKITAVVKQADRFLVFKQNSIWALEGNDPSNYRVVFIFGGAGCAGPRAVACMGSVGWFFGSSGLHRIVNNDIRPFGYVEVGDVISSFSKTAYADVVVRNHLGQRVLIAFSTDGVENNDMLVYDQRFQTWAEWTGWYCQDILVPHIHDFGDQESFLFIDARNRNTVPSPVYEAWIGFYGFKDEKAAAGTGGVGIPMRLRTPWIDDGSPDVFKRWERGEWYLQGSGLSVNIAIETDPGEFVARLQVQLPSSASLWGDGRLWGDGSFWGAASSDSSASQGLPDGTHGRRYRMTLSANVLADGIFKGYVLDGIFQPERRYS